MRLNTEKQEALEPVRVAHAKKQIEALGHKILFESSGELRFEFRGNMVKLFPYSGWHTGASIDDGRGLDNLLKQLA